MTEAQPARLNIGQKAILAVLCLCSGVAPIAAHWIADSAAKFGYSLLLAALFLAITLIAKRASAGRPFWELPFAFFVLALVQVLYNLSPFFGTYILHESPVPGNPQGSTIFGTVAVQLYETLAAIVPVIILTKVAGKDLGSVYARRGKLGIWLIVALAVGVVVYGLAAAHLSNGLFPTNGLIPFDRLLALTPALLAVVIMNGFQEEFLLRGLFLQKYEAFFGARAANILQAAVFAIWHVGVTYTPGALFFIVVFVFPLGLIAGFLMRKTEGIITPALFHAGLDIPIFLAFLSYVS